MSMQMKRKMTTAHRLYGCIILIVILSLALALTTFALVYSTVSVEGNLFESGYVGINLNGGKQIINEDEFIFEPGMTVTKDFYIENMSSCSVYYRLYFENVSGSLAEVLEVSVNQGDKVLYEGKASTLMKENVKAADDSLEIGERRELTITFHFPEEAGNEAQNLYLSFDFAAEATQMKNNENREF